MYIVHFARRGTFAQKGRSTVHRYAKTNLLACRSREDRLAFAVHCYLLADGYKLVAAGRDADEADIGTPPPFPLPPPNAYRSAPRLLSHERANFTRLRMRLKFIP